MSLVKNSSGKQTIVVFLLLDFFYQSLLLGRLSASKIIETGALDNIDEVEECLGEASDDEEIDGEIFEESENEETETDGTDEESDYDDQVSESQSISSNPSIFSQPSPDPSLISQPPTSCDTNGQRATRTTRKSTQTIPPAQRT